MNRINPKLIEKAIKKIIKGNGKYLVVSINDNVNPKLLKQRIEEIIKKENLSPKNVIVEKDNEGNKYDIPIGVIIERKDYELQPVGIYINGKKIKKF